LSEKSRFSGQCRKLNQDAGFGKYDSTENFERIQATKRPLMRPFLQ
jgi:hypothetical protein